MKTRKPLTILFMVWLLASVGYALPMGTEFTYQGRLIDGNDVADGLYDFQFKLYDSNVAGTQKGSTIDIGEVDVIDGYFTVNLDFGSDPNIFSGFNGDAYWLQIGVRVGELEDPNAYTILMPRQQVTPTPYAIYAQTSAADSDWIISGNNMYSSLSGNVGIGTTSPQNRLHVTDSSGNIAISSETMAADAAAILKIVAPGGRGELFFGGSSYSLWGGPLSLNLFNVADGPITFGHFIGNTGYERMRITSSGNVGIGTIYPAAKLTVYNPAAPDGPTIQMLTQGSGNTNTFLEILKNDYNPGWTINQARKGLSITDNSTTWTISTNRNAGDWGQTLRFGTLKTCENYTSGFNDLMVIQANGYVGIGGITNPTSKLSVNGDIDAASVYKIGGYTVLSVPLTLVGNTLVGIGAGKNNTGLCNTFVGYDVGYSNTGSLNTFSGYLAGHSNTAGCYNTFLGCEAGCLNTTGNCNTYLGDTAGYANKIGSGNVFIGYGAGSDTNYSNKLYIANGPEIANVLICGDFSTNKIGLGTAFISSSQAINTGTGAYLSTAGFWTNNSSRDAKENFMPVDGREVLETLIKVPVSIWNYKVDDKSTRHMGPMAQDLYEAFKLGNDDKSIATIDSDGISLAAIQGLYQIVKEKESEIATLKKANEDIRNRLNAIETLLAEISLKNEGGIK